MLEIVKYTPQVETLRAEKELLPRGTDFQSKYNAAIRRLGRDYVHKRDPKEPRDIMCMDEGLLPPGLVTVRLAGPVPLLARTLPALKEGASNGIIYGRVYDHESCGALGLNLAAIGGDMDAIKAGEAMTRGFARELTAAYGGRLPLQLRPKDKHTGQIVFYDARKSGLDLAHLDEFEPGYTVSEGIFGADASRDYTNLALTIAFGDHGLNGDLTDETPLHLVGIADTEKQIKTLRPELELIRSSRGEDARRIQVHVIAA